MAEKTSKPLFMNDRLHREFRPRHAPLAFFIIICLEATQGKSPLKHFGNARSKLRLNDRDCLTNNSFYGFALNRIDVT